MWVTGAAVPRRGHGEQADPEALFPPVAFSRSQRDCNADPPAPPLDESAAELKARAAVDVETGRLRAVVGTPGS